MWPWVVCGWRACVSSLTIAEAVSAVVSLKSQAGDTLLTVLSRAHRYQRGKTCSVFKARQNTTLCGWCTPHTDTFPSPLTLG